MCQYCRPLIKAIDAYIQKADNDLADVLEDEGYADAKETVSHIDTLEDNVADALKAETDYIVSEAEDCDDLKDFQKKWSKIKAGDTVAGALSKAFSEEFETMMPQLIQYYIQQTDKSLKLASISKKTTAWVQSWSEQLGDIMKLNSHTEIENILTTGLEKGQGIAEFTRQILDSGIRDEYYKARRVAVTEVLTAHRVSQQEAFMQSPSVAEKGWKHTGEYRNAPRQNHVDMDGQRVPKDQPYELTGADGGLYYPMYPGDTNLPPGERINCHCISQPIVDESILGMSLEDRQKLQQEAIDAMDDEWEKELDAQNKAKAGIDDGD